MSVTVNGGINFNHVIFKGYVEPVFDPLDLFALGQLGAWYDPTDLSVMFQTNTEATPVTAQGQTVGRINDKTPNAFYASQSTAANRPLLDNYSNVVGQSAAINRLKYDFSNDALLWSGTTGTYWIAYANITGVQIYQCLLTNNQQIPVIEFSQMIIRDTAFTGPETIALTNYLEQYRTGLTTPNMLHEFLTTTYAYNSSIMDIGSGSAHYNYGTGADVPFSTSSTVITGLTPRESFSFTISPSSELIKFGISSPGACTGSIPDLSEYTAMTNFQCNLQKFQGGVPDLSANIALKYFNCRDNTTLTGTIPDLTANIALNQLIVDGCNFSGELPLLPASITVVDFSRNNFTGIISDLTVYSNLGRFVCNFTGLTGGVPNLPASIDTFECRNNPGMTGTVSNLDANVALQQFIVSENNLSGSFPSLIFNTSLSYIDAHTNNIAGPLPTFDTNTVLSYVDLSNNSFTGSVPDTTLAISLFYFDCNNCLLNGTIGPLSPAIGEFYCYDNQLTGSIPDFTGLSSLTYFECENNQLTGSIPDLSDTDMYEFNCSDNLLSGNIPDISTNVNLSVFNCSNNSAINGWTGTAVSYNLQQFLASGCSLPTSTVNALLAALVAAGNNNGGLNIAGGTNAAPTGQGITDKATLQSRGWTVTTN